VAVYSGNVYDALSYSDGMMFSTYDRDNDLSTDNCAVAHGGGFWYKDCANCRVNTVRGVSDDFAWNGWKLQSSRMWLMCH